MYKFDSEFKTHFAVSANNKHIAVCGGRFFSIYHINLDELWTLCCSANDKNVKYNYKDNSTNCDIFQLIYQSEKLDKSYTLSNIKFLNNDCIVYTNDLNTLISWRMFDVAKRKEKDSNSWTVQTKGTIISAHSLNDQDHIITMAISSQTSTLVTCDRKGRICVFDIKPFTYFVAA